MTAASHHAKLPQEGSDSRHEGDFRAGERSSSSCTAGPSPAWTRLVAARWRGRWSPPPWCSTRPHPDGIADSKALDAKTRRSSTRRSSPSAAVGIGVAGVDRIDSDNILKPRCGPWRRRWRGSVAAPKLVLVDGNKAPHLDCTTRAIVQGDAKCLSIAAASIVAKVARDAMMAELARDYPDYGFDRHKGYGTARAPCGHRQARRHAPPSPLVPAGAAGPRAGVSLQASMTTVARQAPAARG